MSDIFDWNIRWVGPSKDKGRKIHLGGEDTYLALYSHADKHLANTSHKTITHLNHIGILVDDLCTVEKKVKASGFMPYNYNDYESGKRFYFDLELGCEDKIEIEVVSYNE